MMNMYSRPRFSWPMRCADGATVVAVLQHRRRARLDAELVFDADAVHVVALAVGSTFGQMNSEMPFTPSGAPTTRASTMWTMLSAMSCSP